MGATKRKRVQLTEQEKLQKNLSLTISRVFKRAGFLYLPTRNKHHVFGGKDIEIDGVYLFENIILFCEDTISKESSHAVKTAENAQSASAGCAFCLCGAIARCNFAGSMI